jgi:hypothetical protein
MPRKKSSHVFLNVPFDPDYEPLFVALIAGLTAFDLTPRTVLEIPAHDAARVGRLRGLALSPRAKTSVRRTLLECRERMQIRRLERGDEPRARDLCDDDERL